VHKSALTSEQIIITSAGVSALMIAIQALVSPGDAVVVVEPVWPNLPSQARIMGARLHSVALQVMDGRWQLDLDELLAAITPDTRLVMVNSPNNPTGWTMPAEQVQKLLAHCRKTGTWIIADEVYHRLYNSESVDNNPQSAPSLLEYAHINDRVVVVHSFSKSFWMTGWRLGAMIAPPALSAAIGKLMEFNTSCAPMFVQRAGLAAVADAERHVANVRAQLKAALPVLLQGLQALPGAVVPVPDGAMYVFFKLAGFDDSLTIAKRLVSEAGLGLAPGAAFGAGDVVKGGWLRWCYAGTPERMQEGVRRLEKWLQVGR
jgi:aspartate/methionine/tyrosine aminotransferase